MKDVLLIIALQKNGIGWYGLERCLILRDNPIPKNGILMSIIKELEQTTLIESKKLLDSEHP